MAASVSQRQLNRALLARQMLLERASVPLPRALERMGCLQAQYAPSMYIGLWSRVEGLERDAVTWALERKKVVQGTLMRQTIHLVSTADYWPLAVAVREARRDAWIRTRKSHDAKDVEKAARRLRRRFAEGPVSRSELSEALGKDPVMVNAIGLWLDLVRVPPSGTWERRRADLFAAAEDWLGEPGALSTTRPRSSTSSVATSRASAPRRRRRSPPGAACRRARSRPPSSGSGCAGSRPRTARELVDLPRLALPDPDTPAPPRFLPTWDATLLVHARRTGILPGSTGRGCSA